MPTGCYANADKLTPVIIVQLYMYITVIRQAEMLISMFVWQWPILSVNGMMYISVYQLVAQSYFHSMVLFSGNS